MSNTITVKRGPDCLLATFAGPGAQKVLDLFGTATLPLPQATPEEAAAQLRSSWPSFRVVVA